MTMVYVCIFGVVVSVSISFISFECCVLIFIFVYAFSLFLFDFIEVLLRFVIVFFSRSALR